MARSIFVARLASAALCAASLTFAFGAVAQEQDAGPVDGGAAPPAGLEAGDTCDVNDDQCGTGTVCATVFQGAGTACYNTCETAGAACTGLSGPGTCTQTVQNGPLFCVSVSPLGGPCGDVANATCNPAETALCLSTTQGSVGFCAVICTPADPTTCSQAAQFQGAPGCGCVGTQVCSSSPLSLQGGDGVCTQPNPDGPCGTNPNTGVIELCTNGQQCGGINDITGYGTCAGTVEPNPQPGAEPGVVEPGVGPGAEPAPSPAAEPAAEPEGRTEPEPTPDPGSSDGCSSSSVPSTGIPAALGLLGLLGVALRRRRR